MQELAEINKINAVVKAPPSKSYTNRALLIASLADGKSVLNNVLVSDDTKYMAEAIREFGIKIEKKDDSLIVDGTGGKLKAPEKELFVGNAGTAMRFLTTFAALAKGKTTITGDKRMQQRPIKDLLSAIEKLGVKTESSGFPPVTVHSGLTGGKTRLNGATSSQYLSSILMAAPYSKNDVEIEIEGDLTSKPYVDMTISIMKEFGVEVINENYKKFIIKNQKYKAKTYTIEGDASNASYFFAAAAIAKGRVKVTNINPETAQGDIKFVDLLEKMGCKVEKEKNSITIEGKELNAIDIDMNSMPDVVQTLAVVALFANGKTRISNIANLRVKETDRIKALAAELRKIGAIVEEKENAITIEPNKLHGAEIETYNDHRMAMSFAVAGLRIKGIKIKNPKCVNKSFPGFFDELEKLY